VSFEPSARAEEFGGCRLCLHYLGQGRCSAFPTRIPLPIFAGDIDHMVVRPGQIGDATFEEIDFKYWQATGGRRPAAEKPSRIRAS
jgi:hypothetical protein